MERAFISLGRERVVNTLPRMLSYEIRHPRSISGANSDFEHFSAVYEVVPVVTEGIIPTAR